MTRRPEVGAEPLKFDIAWRGAGGKVGYTSFFTTQPEQNVRRERRTGVLVVDAALSHSL